MGFDLEGRPKVRRVCVRRNCGEKSKGEVAAGVTELPNE